MNRRAFLKGVIAGVAVPYVSGCAGLFASQKVRLACIGLGPQGCADIRAFLASGLCEVAAICDVDARAVRAWQAENPECKVASYADFRVLLDREAGRIDAVVVATPDFSHFPILMDAMRRGLAVYSESPLAHTFEENALLMAAERKYGVVTRTAGSGRSGCDGIPGGTHEVHVPSLPASWRPSGAAGSFPKAEELPKDLDWDLWLASASRHSHSSEYLSGRWRSWYDFGGGALGAVSGSVLAQGCPRGRLPNAVSLRASKGWNPYVFPSLSETSFLYGLDGDGSRHELLCKERDGDASEACAAERDGIVDFLRAVRGEGLSQNPFSVAGVVAQTVCLGCIAQRLNRGFRFDPAKGKVIGDEVAERLLRGSPDTPRRGWEQYYRT